ncbi:hypothetical protein MCOR27_003420 [Pyricularia oryzae]|uniref:CoxI translation protein CYA5 n=1 Tax=Pyricularia grisea TaxID=148305 RepID=A0ABQ8NNT4_PYRGI|nr:hypothetical protein MCOR01_002999 [Pyricularia oryzae]KAI6299355.1 hypothetical protein MCOR33_004687 [Pyricularia grisea]KAI6283068.1 hypothetical protein MCOR27_003420 [Pyricularia oryzae]KAI6288501.1 hypothetical protein MCOR26_000101 [Pyricularia oryzae]KAI6328062.1 hypothetical protein MCOR29_002788 [Pyricularia oryzae]
MPVIERSAAILEPGSLHKTLTTVRTARQLHAAFWRHGAAELELLSAGQMLPGDCLSTPSDAGPGRPDGPMMASILPFDFLYPQSSAGLRQRLYSSPITGVWEQSERLRRPYASGRPDARAYTSHAIEKPTDDSIISHKEKDTEALDESGQKSGTNPQDQSQNSIRNDDESPENSGSRADVPLNVHHAKHSGKLNTTESDRVEVYTKAKAGAPEASRSEQSRQVKAKNSATQSESKPSIDQDAGDHFPIKAHERVLGGQLPYGVNKRRVKQALVKKKVTGVLPRALEEDLTSTNYGAISRPARHVTVAGTKESFDRLDHLWEEFQNLSPEEQYERAHEMILDLSQSQRLADHWRITQIFPLIRENVLKKSKGDGCQTAAHVRAAIRAYYALGDSETGMKIYRSWINEKRRPVGFGYPAAEIIKAADWPRLAELWQEYFDNIFWTPNFHQKDSESLASLGLNPQKRIQRSVELEQTEAQHIHAIPGFKEKVLQLFDYVFDKHTPDQQRKPLESFLILSIRWLLPQYKPRDAFRMVLRLEDSVLCQEFIELCVQRGQLALATQAYIEIRLLPGRGLPAPVLRLLIKEIFLPQRDVQKMELVMQDWLRRYPRLDIMGYRAFLSLYSVHGDVASFKRIYDMFVKEYPDLAWTGAYDMLMLYRRRGDTEMVQQLFDEMESRYKRKPKIIHWNVLLSAYKRDHNRALEVFAALCEAVEPNETSFAIIMKILGWRGELQLVRELHQIGIDRGIQMTPRSRVGLIDALCINERLDVAERICKEETLQANNKESRSKVRFLWNRLIRHYATRRDLVSCHRILNEMGDNNVGYDSETYYFLLMGLAYTRQAHHGLHLIRAALLGGVFKPSAKHFLLLMAGFIRNGELHMVAKVDELLTNAGLPRSSSTTLRNILALLEADKRGFKSPDGKVLSSDNLRHALSTFTDFLRERRAGAQERAVNIYPQDVGRLPTDLFASLIFFAVTIRQDKAVADKLLEMFRIQEGDNGRVSHFSDIRMLVSILNYEAFQRDFDDVMAIWESIFEMAREAGRSAAADFAATDDASSPRRTPDLIAPAWKFVLADSLKTMQRLLETRGDASALKALFQRVRAAGFELTGPNWNHYIQGLARLGEWREAFTLCERVLMPQWKGWARPLGQNREAKIKLPLEVRRMGTRLDYRRPVSYTIIELGRHYREMINLAPWSREADELLSTIRAQCPMLIRAISSFPGFSYPAQDKIIDGTATLASQGRWSKMQANFNAESAPGSDEAVGVLDSFLAEMTAEDEPSGGLEDTVNAEQADTDPESQTLPSLRKVI